MVCLGVGASEEQFHQMVSESKVRNEWTLQWKPVQVPLLSLRLFRAFNTWVDILADLKQGDSILSSPIYHPTNTPEKLVEGGREGAREGGDPTILLNRPWEQVLLNHAMGKGSSLGLDLISIFIPFKAMQRWKGEPTECQAKMG